MEFNGNMMLTSLVLCARISLSIKVDSFNHAKAKDHRLLSVVFHSGYLSFYFLSNHLLMKFATTPAMTEMIKLIIMHPSFLNKDGKTLGILYHIWDLLQWINKKFFPLKATFTKFILQNERFLWKPDGAFLG